MIHLSTIRVMLDHGDWANDRILAAAAPLADELLDRPFDMGPGSIRRTMLHTHAGEDVWLKRLMGQPDTKWVNEREHASVAVIAERWKQTRAARDAFLPALRDGDLSREQPYRDSRGTLYRTTPGDMLIQMCLHSNYHRAQLVNMLRRVGAEAPELDYMYRVRRPA